MENILEVKGLNKTYQDFSLKDISFSLPEGVHNRLYRYKWSRENHHITVYFRINTDRVR